MSVYTRLQRVLDSFSPSEVLYEVLPNASGTVENVLLAMVEVKHLSFTPNGDELQQAVLPIVESVEEYDYRNLAPSLSSQAMKPEWLFNKITQKLCAEYESKGKRSTATKRKTTRFIGDISVFNELLATSVIAMYITTQSPAWSPMPETTKQDYLEKLDVLRRTYAK